MPFQLFCCSFFTFCFYPPCNVLPLKIPCSAMRLCSGMWIRKGHTDLVSISFIHSCSSWLTWMFHISSIDGSVVSKQLFVMFSLMDQGYILWLLVCIASDFMQWLYSLLLNLAKLTINFLIVFLCHFLVKSNHCLYL